MRRPRPQEVHRITDAPEDLATEQARRVRTYLIQMAVRLVCIFLAVLVPGPLRWVFIAGAVLLPYSAVLFANAGRKRAAPSTGLDPRQITSDGEKEQD